MKKCSLFQRLKQLTKRQVDLNFEQLVQRYQAKQKEQEDLAFKAKYVQTSNTLSSPLFSIYTFQGKPGAVDLQRCPLLELKTNTFATFLGCVTHCLQHLIILSLDFVDCRLFSPSCLVFHFFFFVFFPSTQRTKDGYGP